MRQPHLYALITAILLTTVLVLVVGGDPTPDPEPEITARVLTREIETATTTTDLEFSDDAPTPPVLPEFEVELTDYAVSRSTTTTTTVPTTAPVHAPHKKSSAPKPNTTTPTSTTQPPAPDPEVKAEFRSDYESDFHGQINSLRASRGLAALARNGSLNARARDWARTMADSGSLKHSNIGSLVPPWSAAAENVGKGGTVALIYGLLEASSGHLSNMVANYTDIGIGVWQDSNGTLWTVHVFTR